MEERCNYNEDHSRRNNLRIVGGEEQHDETWEQTAIQVSKLLESKLELPNIHLERAHRVRRRFDQRSRPIVARFSRYCDREAVMRNVRKLRGTRIYINEDLCPASQSIKKAQIPLMKQARNEGKLAYFRHTKLIIKERTSAPTQGSSSGTTPAASGIPARSAGADGGHDSARVQGITHGPHATSAVASGHGGAGAAGAVASHGVTDVTAAGVWRVAGVAAGVGVIDGDAATVAGDGDGAAAAVAGGSAASRTPIGAGQVGSPSTSRRGGSGAITTSQRNLRQSQRGPKK